MKAAVLIFLTATLALAQSHIPSYEPHKLMAYLQQVREQEGDCKKADKTCESFWEDEAVTKELQTSLALHGCEEFGESLAKLDGVLEAGFVRMQCGWDLNLVFTEREDAGWRFLQTVVVPNKYWEAKVSVASVTGDDSQQVLIHKAQYQSGTGISQQNFVVYKLVDGKIIPVLDVVESSHLMLPWTQHEVWQESKFLFSPPEKMEFRNPANQREFRRLDSPPTFAETQIIEFPGERVELKRDHMWMSDRRFFLATQWSSARRLYTSKKTKTAK
jgi:hypothetical protein